MAESDGSLLSLPTPSAGRVPAAYKEQALWLLEGLLPGTGINNVAIAFRVDGQLQYWVLRETMLVLLRRYEVLRTVFYGDETGLTKQILPPEELGLSVMERSVSPGDLDALIADFAATPFTFDGKPLIRVCHFEVDGGDVLCAVVHHLIFDAASGPLLLKDFIAAYDGVAAGREQRNQTFSEVAAFDEAPPREETFAFWREQLQDLDPAGLELGFGKQGILEYTPAGDRVGRTLSGKAAGVVKELQNELKASEAVVLLAAYFLLLHRHGSAPDMTVGVPVNTRGHAASLIGYHVNLVAARLHVDLTGTFRDLVNDVRHVFLDGISHSDISVESAMLDVIHGAGRSWRSPIFRHVFNYVPESEFPEFMLDYMRARPIPVAYHASRFDLELYVQPIREEIRLSLMYSTDLFARPEAESLLARYDILLAALGDGMDRPMSELPLLTEEDRALVRRANRAEQAPLVLELVAARVRDTPDAPAVQDGDRVVTYGDLWRAAISTKDRLNELGVAKGDVVGLAVPRSAELAAAIIGIWLAGAAYVAAGSGQPLAHAESWRRDLGARMRDLGARTIVTEAGAAYQGLVTVTVPAVGHGDGEELQPVQCAASPDGLRAGEHAYLVHWRHGGDSAVPVSHTSLADAMAHFRAQLGSAAHGRTLWLSAPESGMSVLELLLPLTAGALAVVAPDDTWTSGKRLAALLSGDGGSAVVQGTPTRWRRILDQVGEALAGHTVLCGGEPLASELAIRLLATGCELHVWYGCAEVAGYAASARVNEVPAGGDIPVGAPVTGTHVLVLDPGGHEVPAGVRGDLFVGTADREAGHPGARPSIRTGDQGRWLADGTLELFGPAHRMIVRQGRQVSLRSIEAALREHPGIADMAVVAVGEHDPAIVAFAEPADTVPQAGALAEFAVQRLPAELMPGKFLLLDELPTTADGRVDQRALAQIAAVEMARHAVSRPAPDAAPREDGAPGDSEGSHEGGDARLVGVLVDLWRDLLRSPGLQTDSNFFACGGTSMLAVQLARRIEAATGVRPKLIEVFKRPTPTALAEYLSANHSSSARPEHAETPR
jgi:non-ribosomal peptide synthetase component F